MESTSKHMGRRDRTAPRARGFFLPGGKVGILLIHGFAGSIDDLRKLGEELHVQSMSVRGVCLAGHGLSVDDLDQSVAEDWLASARTELANISQTAEQVVIIGESMGGLLGLRLSRENQMVRGVVLLAPLMKLRREFWRNLVSAFLPSFLKIRKPWVTKAQESMHREKGSPLAFTVGSFRQLLRVVRSERSLLHLTTVPVLTLFAEGDRVSDPGGEQVFRSALPQDQLEIHVVAEELHHLGQVQNLKEILDPIVHFIKRVTESFL